MSGAVIVEAQSAAETDAVRELFRAYGEHLATTASICIETLGEEIASLPTPYFLLLLAKIDSHPAGCVALKTLARDGEQACELKRLWVSPAFRGYRVGKRLMEAAIHHATGSGYTALYLDTVPAAMPEANHLYKALGFERIGRYNDNPVADVAFFRLALPSASVRI